MDGFYEALQSFIVDPGTWPNLFVAFDKLAEHVDPAELIPSLSDAEALSWRMKEGEPAGHPWYGYVLLDAHGRAVGSSVNLQPLHDYATTDENGKLRLSHPASHASLAAALDQIRNNKQSHALVSLVHPTRAGSRYGCLISRQAFPAALKSVVGDDVFQALFVTLEEEDSKRFTDAVRATLGLTATEAEVATRIAQGFALKELAADLNISLSTARNHLQSVFDKSGINRQSELVAAITRLSILLSLTHYELDSTPVMKRPPAPARKFLVLEHGRRLAFRTYGSPSGKPVLFLHEIFGCSLLPADTWELAGKLDLFLIVPERPGFGFSDSRPDYGFRSVNQDLVALLDHLQVDRCALLGYLSGGAFALRLAETHPHRVSHLMLVSGRPPQPVVHVHGHLKPLFAKVMAQPWLLRSILNILRNRASARTIRQAILTLHGSSASNRKILDQQPQLMEHLIAVFMESIAVTTAGAAMELRCFAEAGKEPHRRLEIPIVAWHGTGDDTAELHVLKDYLAGQEIRWRLFPEAGALLIYDHWQEVLAALAGD